MCQTLNPQTRRRSMLPQAMRIEGSRLSMEMMDRQLLLQETLALMLNFDDISGEEVELTAEQKCVVGICVRLVNETNEKLEGFLRDIGCTGIADIHDDSPEVRG